MWRYLELLSRRTAGELAALREGHPRDAKVALAGELVTRFHGPAAARDAEERFARIHARREVPERLEERALPLGGAAALPLAHALAEAGLAASRSDARRLIAQGGVSIDGARAGDVAAALGPGVYVVKVGKRRFLKVRIGG